ncbi:hypothetical protein [Prosthecobacter sp.]
MILSLDVLPGDGERFQRAQFSCWLPDAGKPVTAVIIHQHGCTNASPVKHPPVTGDLHWRALARKHGCALLVPMYQVAKGCDEWNNPDSGSERALFTALADFAQRSGRSELKDVPWVLWGHSGGSSWSAQMIVRHPKRVLAASFRGGCHKQFGDPAFRAKFAPVALHLPLLFVWGKRETVPTSSHHVSWAPMNTMLRELRSQGGTVARVIDPRSEHDCCDSRLLVTSFFDVVLEARTARQELPGALVDMTSLQHRETKDANLKDPAAAWLPTPGLARMWREFSETGSLHPSGTKLAQPVLNISRSDAGHVRLTWRIDPSLDGGLRAIRIHRDGKPWKEFTLKPGAFLATARDSTPEELRQTEAVDDSAGSHTYELTYSDGAGNESPPSQIVAVP